MSSEETELTKIKESLNGILRGGLDFEGEQSKGVIEFRHCFRDLVCLARTSSTVAGLNLEDYLSEGFESDKETIETALKIIDEINRKEVEYQRVLSTKALFEHETLENWMDLCQREEESLERLQRLVKIYQSLAKIAKKLVLCISPRTRVDITCGPYVLITINPYDFFGIDVHSLEDETHKEVILEFQKIYPFQNQPPPFFEKLKSADKLISETKKLFSKKYYSSLLYKGFFETCYFVNKNKYQDKVNETRRKTKELEMGFNVCLNSIGKSIFPDVYR